MRPQLAVAINIDLGELPGEPDELYALADIVNVACGGHAGDDASMARAAGLAALHGACLAAHPSYPDREGFGRRSLAMSPGELRREVAAQCARLRGALPPGAALRHVKPHGALYHDCARDPALASALLDGAAEGLCVSPASLLVLGPPGLDIGPATLLREGFADRGYDPRGHLLPRGSAGALLTDPAAAAAQALRLTASGGFDTLCVHGDTPGAVAVARAVRSALA